MPTPEETTLAVSESDETVVEFRFNDGAGIMTMEGSCVTLYCRPDEAGRLTMYLAPNGTMRARVVHPLASGESIQYRVCPPAKLQKHTAEWETFTAPGLPKKPFWKWEP